MNCKGSYLLQTACQICDKCNEELSKLKQVAEIEEQNDKLKQANEILMIDYRGSVEDLNKTVEFLSRLNKVSRYLIFDLKNGEVGLISNIKINDLEELSSGEIEIIDFSEDEPRIVTEDGYEKIKML